MPLREVTPAGWEYNDNGRYPMQDPVVVGDLVRVEADGWHLLPINDSEPDGVVLMDAYDGEPGPSIGIHPEIEGYTGMAPGTLYYPSTTVVGKLQTGVNGNPCAKAVTPTKMRFFIR